MNKFLSFVGRNASAFLAALWLVLAIGEVVVHQYYAAFLQLQLAMCWLYIYSNEQSEKRLIEKLINRK